MDREMLPSEFPLIPSVATTSVLVLLKEKNSHRVQVVQAHSQSLFLAGRKVRAVHTPSSQVYYSMGPGDYSKACL